MRTLGQLVDAVDQLKVDAAATLGAAQQAADDERRDASVGEELLRAAACERGGLLGQPGQPGRQGQPGRPGQPNFVRRQFSCCFMSETKYIL